MKKFKFILPVVAFVMAIGMSFAYVKVSENVALIEVIERGGAYWQVDVQCNDIVPDCQVQLTDDSGVDLPGELYPVFIYDTATGNTVPALDSSGIPKKFRESDLEFVAIAN
ncbi:DUF6520 family protein [Sinomicrobium soli]|uniref:DUF6520 family protein n=1 Tax=Sinomicrobium sp. N-1-3-6 TaxID=2219864 RepID=UPI000DCAFBAD|nr:DUF6520 family protein [Sinomicrobium sp. N-1-3-6]RAV27714.1 hypothetical protein DN748_16975 [Sinomicrobium sp. N-1-3-6]